MNRHIAILSLACITLVGTAHSADASRRSQQRTTIMRGGLHPRMPSVTRDVTGDRCANTVRAAADARRQLVVEVKNWLEEVGIDHSWVPPQPILNDMVIGQPDFTPETLRDGDHELNLVRATIKADFSEGRRREFLNVYHQHVGGRRLVLFGGGLTLLLAALAAISGYIRADEATKGYYTNRLRLLAAAGVGAAGMVVYQILT
jgi:hypothetical protein